MTRHSHYCQFRRHTWSHHGDPDLNNDPFCAASAHNICPSCEEFSERHASVVMPTRCVACGIQKLDALGEPAYVGWRWAVGKRIVCEDCKMSEDVMKGLDKLVWHDDDDDLPF